MLVSDIINRVRSIAGDENVVQFTDAQALDWINDGIRECAIVNNLLQKRAVTALIPGTSAYTVPPDVLKLHTVRVDDVKLRVMTLQEFDSYNRDGDDPGTPQLCYVWVGQVHLYPTPQVSDSTLTFDYTYDPAVIAIEDIGTASPDLPATYHARLVDYCLAQVAQQDGDSNLYAMKMQEFKTGVQDLKDLPEWEYDQYPFIGVSARDSGEGDFYYGEY